jgi:hypothetical protein
MRDNMLVNLTGLEGHAMPIDINMEHLIGQLKVFLNSLNRIALILSAGLALSQGTRIYVGSTWRYLSGNRLLEQNQEEDVLDAQNIISQFNPHTP